MLAALQIGAQVFWAGTYLDRDVGGQRHEGRLRRRRRLHRLRRGAHDAAAASSAAPAAWPAQQRGNPRLPLMLRDTSPLLLLLLEPLHR